MPKVLLADDSTHAQRMGSKILAAEGIEVIAVSNGEAAIKKLKAGGIDLVLADVFMPVRDGYEICEFVKKSAQHAHIPVVLVVGKLEPYDPDHGERVKADGLLTKPFETSVMLDTLRPLFERVEKFKQEKQAAATAAATAAAEAAKAEAAEEAAAAVEETKTTSTATRLEVPKEMADQPLSFDEGLEAAPAAVTPPSAPPPATIEPEPPAEEPAPAAPAAPEAATAEEVAPRWVAQPTEVTEADRARFEEPAAAPAQERKPEAPPDWGELLKSVEEEPAAAAGAFAPVQPQETPPPEVTQVFGAPAPSSAPPPEPAPEVPADVQEPGESAATAAPAPEQPAAASAAQASVSTEPDVLDHHVALIRDAVQACLERSLPILVDEISSEVLRRLYHRE